MSGSVALDTNVAIAVLNDDDNAGNWIAGFDAICLPVPVVCEFRYGALNSQRATENLGRVDQLIQHCEALPITLETADVYARVRMRLKRAGKPIPENDVWIAAICVQRDVPLATYDDHFKHVEGLRTLATPG